MTRRADAVLLSGGLDSTTALALRHAAGTAALAVSVNYGQRHARELDAAAAIAARYDVDHTVIDLAGWGRMLSGSALTDPDVAVPHGHYADESMRATIVPNRNAVLLMAAAGVALAEGCDTVVTAVHAGDHPVYPDCRPAFITAAKAAMELGTDGKVTLDAPFVAMSKTAIAGLGAELSAPLGSTWSCYEGGQHHCGRCGTCVERREAFTDAGIPDPTVYAEQVGAA